MDDHMPEQNCCYFGAVREHICAHKEGERVIDTTACIVQR